MGPEFDSGRYRLQERLTPDGETWLAEDLEDTGARVTVKFLPEGSDVIAARHLVESNAQVEAPGVSLPCDEGEAADGRTFLVYRWVQGITLRELLNQEGPLPFRRAAGLIRQLGDAVGYLHERGMVHGGIAPDHVVVHHEHGRDHLVILQGGAFRITRQSSVSPAYLAPEQLAGSPVPASDLWSVAALAAEMLTGRRAFRYGSISELHHLHRRGIARGAFRKARPKLPIRVEDELRRALSWDPAARPSDVQILTTRLAEFLGGTGGLPRRRLATLGALGLAVIVLGIRNCRRRWANSR